MTARHLTLLRVESQLFTELCRRERFTLDEAWRASHAHYSWVSQMLLRWWREGLLERRDAAGGWQRGYLFSKPDRTRIAEYRWVDTP